MGGAEASDERAVMARRPLVEPAGLLASSSERPPLRRLRQAGVDPAAGVPVTVRKPAWLRVPARMGDDYRSVAKTMGSLSLTTVCEEAGCPNIYECWAAGTATFMVNGSRCTRACGFCQVDTRHPLPLDVGEPDRVGEAVARMNLAHAVVTCVARDDLADGGAGAIAATVEAIRRHRPGTSVETLISDCKGDRDALELVFAVRPDILNHNIETVARLQRAVRPSAGYARSLAVLAQAAAAGLVVKSGLMVGLGEAEDEVIGHAGRSGGGGGADRDRRPVLAPVGRAPTGRALLEPRGVRSVASGRARARPGPRGVLAAHPILVPRPRRRRCGAREGRTVARGGVRLTGRPRRIRVTNGSTRLA